MTGLAIGDVHHYVTFAHHSPKHRGNKQTLESLRDWFITPKFPLKVPYFLGFIIRHCGSWRLRTTLTSLILLTKHIQVSSIHQRKCVCWFSEFSLYFVHIGNVLYWMSASPHSSRMSNLLHQTGMNLTGTSLASELSSLLFVFLLWGFSNSAQ